MKRHFCLLLIVLTIVPAIGYGEENPQIRGSVPILWVLTSGGRKPKVGNVIELPAGGI